MNTVPILLLAIIDKIQAVKFLQEKGILHSSRQCVEGHEMYLSLTDKEDNWRCSWRSCPKKVCIRKDTWLEHSGGSGVHMEGPIFRLEPPPWLEFTNSSGALLSCAATGSPSPHISWIDALDTPVTQLPTLRDVLQNGSLYFYPFPSDQLRDDVHTTSYRCLASNPAGKIISRECKLRPEILSDYEVYVDNEYTEEGNIGVLKCLTRGAQTRIQVVNWLRQEPSGLRAPIVPQSKYIFTNSGQLHIRSTSQADTEASFYCETTHAITGHRRISSPGRISITEGGGRSIPRIKHYSESLQVKAGNPVDMICVAQGSPPPSYSWFRERDGILEEVQYGSMIVRTIDSVLRFSRIQTEDAGQYVCVASNALGEDRKQLDLMVFSPLSVHLRPAYQVVDGGSTVMLNCSVEGGTGSFNVAWLKNGKSIIDDMNIRQHENGRVLLIMNIKKEDAGMYQCLARTTDETEQSAAQLVLGSLKPTFQSTFIEQTLQPGVSVSLSCRASGMPPPRISWLLDGSDILSRGGYMLGSFLDTFGDVISYLNITNTRVHHGGIYSCMARNNYGEASHSAALNVYGPPTARPPLNITAVYGSDIMLQCPVAGYPKLGTLWQHRGGHISTKHKQFSNGTLLLRNVNVQNDEGDYTCKVQSQQSKSASSRVYLKIMKPPEIQDFNFPSNLQEGNRAHVSCTVISGDLPIEIIWLKDGNPLPRDQALQVQHHQFVSALLFSNLAADHSGSYTCLARNAAAQANFTSKLVVRVAPSWVLEPKDTSILYHHQATIHCQALGYPPPKITWKFTKASNPGVSTVLSKTNIVVPMENGSLVIKSADHSNKGHYTCEVDNGIGSPLIKTILVKVKVPAFFRVHSTNYGGVAGESIKLICEAEGDIPIHVSWSDSPRKSLPVPHIKYTQNGIISELELQNLSKHDSGKYYCITRNDYGYDTMVIHLTITEVPEVPKNLEIFETGSRWVNVRWEAPEISGTPVKNYIIQFKEKLSTNQWSNLTIGGDMTSARLGTLLPNTVYEVRIFAINKVGTGPSSNTITFSTLQEAPNMAPEEVLVEAIVPEALLVKWKPIRNDLEPKDILGYQIFYYEVSNNIKNVKTLRGQQHHSIKLTNLKYFTKYEVYVRAFNHIGHGPQSTPVIATTMEGVPDAAPTDIRCLGTSAESVRLRWEPPPTDTHNGVILGYKITFKKMIMKYNTYRVPGETKIKKSTNLEVSIHGLSPYSNYSFRILAFTSSGDGTESKSIYCNTEEEVPGPPESIKALIVTSDSILISWAPPIYSNGIIIKYNVYIHHSNNDVQKEIILRNTSLIYEWRRLKEYQRYDFWVTASTTKGEGPKSMKVTQAPESRAPARIASFSSKQLAGEGSRVTFECYAVGLPAPIIVWKDSLGQTLPGSSMNMRVMADNTLVIHPATIDMAGNYTCIVENVFGHDKIGYELIVISVPKPPDVAIVHTTGNSIDVHWKGKSEDHPYITGYILNYKTSDEDWQQLLLGPDQQSYKLKNLKCGTYYFISLQSKNIVGKSDIGSLIKAATKGGMPLTPDREDILLVNATSATIFLDNWPTNGCIILYFIISYRSNEDDFWKLLGDKVPPVSYISLNDLQPATLYYLHITAISEAGSLRHEFPFATRTLNGEMIPLESMPEAPSNFLSEYNFLVPLMAGAFCIITLIVCASFLRSRNCFKITTVTKTLMELENQRNNTQQDHAYSPSPAPKGTSSLSVHKGSDTSGAEYEICPYATFSLNAPNSGHMVKFQTFNQHGSNDCLSKKDYQCSHVNSKIGTSKSPPDGLSLEISCISSQQTLPVEKKKYAEDNEVFGVRRGATTAFVSDSESSGDRPFRSHPTPTFKQHTESTVFELDSSTESAEMSPEIAWRSMLRRGVSSR